MNKILAGAAIVLALGLAAAGWGLRTLLKTNASLEAANAGLSTALADAVAGREADRATWLRQVQAQKALNKQKDQENETLQKALAAHADWSARPVPCSVALALGMRQQPCSE